MKSTLSVIVILLFAATLTFAKNKNLNPYSVSKSSIENLKVGLESENLGLRKSCIYMVGQYKVTEAANSLIKLLDKEQDASARILIVFSLYYLNDESGMIKVKEQASKDSDYQVRLICNTIYDAYSKVIDINNVRLTGRE